MSRMDEGRRGFQSGSPPPMDESWWAAILEDVETQQREDRQATDRRHEFNGHGVGSAEDWNWARKLYETDDTVNLMVIDYNRGGLLVEARGLRGFVPISHLLSAEQLVDPIARERLLSSMVGDELCLKVIEYDPERGRLVFSERAAQAGPGKRAELLASLKPGDRVQGTVTNITRFGVFVDLGGLEGLIHVSELSWGRVRHPSDAVTCGQTLEVHVLSVDREQGRVALSLKELLPDPWETVESSFHAGDIVEGVITNVVRFGAFVGIDEGLEGLIHVSELGDGNVLHPRNVVREGERVRVRVVHIDAASRRLGLSLRQVPQFESKEGEPPVEASSETPEYLSSF